MPKNPWEYFVRVAKLWGQQISGPALALISILSAIAAPIFAGSARSAGELTAALAWLTGGMSIWLIFVAQYRAWRIERESYEGELSRNARPQIQGKVHSFSTSCESNEFDPIKSCSLRLAFRIEVSNVRPVATNIRELQIDGSAMPIPALFDDTTLSEAGEVLKPIEFLVRSSKKAHPDLYPGIHIDLDGSANLKIEGHNWSDFDGTIDLTGLQVKVIDGWGESHILSVQPGAQISIK